MTAPGQHISEGQAKVGFNLVAFIWTNGILPKLDECPGLGGALNVRNVSLTKIGQLLIFRLTQPADEALTRELLPQPVRCKTVLCEAKVKQSSDEYRGRAELFLLFSQIGATDETNSAFMAESGEELKHLRSNGLLGTSVTLPIASKEGISDTASRSKRLIDIEETYRVLHRASFQGWVDACSFRVCHCGRLLVGKARISSYLYEISGLNWQAKRK